MRTVHYVRNDGTFGKVEGSDRAVRQHLAEILKEGGRQVVAKEPVIAPTKNVRNDRNFWEHSDHVEEPLIAPTMNFGDDETFWEPQAKRLVTQHSDHVEEPLIAPIMTFEDRSPAVTNRQRTKPHQDHGRISHEEDGKETPLICPEMIF